MIANKLDGAGGSYYTMGDRKYPELKTYFEIYPRDDVVGRGGCRQCTVIVQMVAFAEPTWQLNRYLKTMEEAGLTEVFLASLRGEDDGRLWRSVPNRRWYSDQRGETPGSQEVVPDTSQEGLGCHPIALSSPSIDSVSDRSSSPSDVNDSMKGAIPRQVISI